MTMYLSNIIPRIQQYSQTLDNLALLMNQHWVVIDEIMNSKVVYIFRQNDELLISQNGIVEEAKWKYLGNGTLLIKKRENSYLFKQGFFDENILALKIDGNNGYAFLANETKYETELNSIENINEFLNENYINNNLVLDSYIAPAFQKTKVSVGHSTSSEREKYTINFEDGESGEVYLILRNNEAFFKEKLSRWVPIEHHYTDFNMCANALHYYLKNGTLRREGYITSYQ